jgi:hypothetical protein
LDIDPTNPTNRKSYMNTYITLWRLFCFSVAFALVATLSILFLQPLLSKIELLPDQGAAWYYWKLPEQSTMGRLTAWGFYFAHQAFFWGLIWWATKNREKFRNRTKLHVVNIIGLAGTAFFIALHYLQTAIWYDGLAQDTSVFSSQISVIILLVIVLIMEAPRRGLFFGRGKNWFGDIRQTLIKYHGYYFAWAVVYTYWFHPMETSLGHLMGFFYTFLLMIQGAFVFTRVHTNRWWTATLELSVVIHGVTVAIIAGQEIWPMFLFGFLAIFVITQLYGLGFSRITNLIVTLIFAGATLAVYSDRGWVQLNEVLRIPVIEYALVVMVGFLAVFVRRRFTEKQAGKS